MVEKKSFPPARKQINWDNLVSELITYAENNFSDSMMFDVTKAKQDFGHNRNIIIEAYGKGASKGLSKYELTESDPTPAGPKKTLPKYGGRGFIPVKKYIVDEYNLKFPQNKIKEDDEFDYELEDGKIILIKQG